MSPYVERPNESYQTISVGLSQVLVFLRPYPALLPVNILGFSAKISSGYPLSSCSPFALIDDPPVICYIVSLNLEIVVFHSHARLPKGR